MRSYFRLKCFSMVGIVVFNLASISSVVIWTYIDVDCLGDRDPKWGPDTWNEIYLPLTLLFLCPPLIASNVSYVKLCSSHRSLLVPYVTTASYVLLLVIDNLFPPPTWWIGVVEVAVVTCIPWFHYSFSTRGLSLMEKHDRDNFDEKRNRKT